MIVNAFSTESARRARTRARSTRERSRSASRAIVAITFARRVWPVTSVNAVNQPAVDRDALERVEQHRLADAAQAGDQQALLRPAGREAAEQQRELLELGIAPGQGGRRRSGAGSVGVSQRVDRLFIADRSIKS